MDRNVITATILITLIMLVWFYFLTPPAPPPGTETTDSLVVVDPEIDEEDPIAALQAAPLPAVTDSAILAVQSAPERLITVNTDLYEAVFSSKGGTFVSFKLHEYQNSDLSGPVQLVDTTRNGALALAFTTPASHNIDTRALVYEADVANDRIELDEDDDPRSLTFTANLGGGTISQTYTFNPGTYEIGLSIDQQNASAFMTREGYELLWDGALPFSENNLEQESPKSGAYAMSGGELEGITLMSETSENVGVRGSIDWMAVKNQYFTAVVIPPANADEVELDGERVGEATDGNLVEHFTARLFMDQPGAEADVYTLYMGPVEYYRLNEYKIGLFKMVDLGWDFFEWISRPVATLVFIPLFSFFSGFIPNYGYIIVLLAVIVKIAVYPLTKKSYRSMAQMRELQPQLKALQEKHKDNPQKQQEATMKLYKESGVNPLGGCVPMLMQYPIIIALWQFLPQSIEIRQQGFLWASDLSRPDVILNLPFNIPFYGDFVAGFCLLMGVSIIIQMRFQATPSAGMQGKMLMYFMPVFLFVIFNKFSSGLNLYYLCYNIITAVQQKFINRGLEKEKEANGGELPRATKKTAKNKKPVSRNGRQRGKGSSRKSSRSRR